MTSWSSRKEIVGKMCKWAKRARVALALRRAGARNSARGPGKVTTSTNHLAGKPLLYSALLTMTLTRADASLCRKKRGGCVLFEKWAANRLAMLESTPRRLLCLREPFSQQSSRVPATLDNVGQYGHRRLGDEA